MFAVAEVVADADARQARAVEAGLGFVAGDGVTGVASAVFVAGADHIGVADQKAWSANQGNARSFGRVAVLIGNAGAFELLLGAVVGATVEVAVLAGELASVADEGDARARDAGFIAFGAIHAACDFETV